MSERDLAHRRSVAVLRMLYKIRCSSAVWAGVGYKRRCDSTSVHLCASSLQNLAVSQDFYSLGSISVERPWWIPIRWCGTGGFQEQGKLIFIGLANKIGLARLIFISCCFPFRFCHSIGWYCGVGVFGLIGCLSLTPSLALPTFFNNNNNRTEP